jgi:hypothetical protein
MRDWMERMGVSVGGETARSLREQAGRISACSLKFFWEDEERGAEGWAAGRIVNSGLRLHVKETHRAAYGKSGSSLTRSSGKPLRDHPVPLLEAAIRELRDRSMSLDLYVWLAWRLHTLAKATPVSWPAICAQFGTGFRELRHFRPRFTEALAAAVAAYPEARVDVGVAGVTLHPSRPPVARLIGPKLSRA